MNTHTEKLTTEALHIRQVLFVRYLTAIMIDLTVLNLFEEHWDAVIIDSFTISLLAAVLLQVLLKVTLKIPITPPLESLRTYFGFLLISNPISMLP